MIVLGVHDGHNAAAALVRDGAVVAALQEERLTRIKNHDTFPERAIARVLRMADLSPADVDIIAMNGDHQPRHRGRDELIRDIRRAGSPSVLAKLKRLARRSPVNTLFRGARKLDREKNVVAMGFSAERVAFIDHHLAHARAAFAASGWIGKPTLVLTCDGAGDDLCATVYVVNEQGGFDRRHAIAEEHSIGMVYLTVTQVLGMVPNEHEYKLMGLAPYAKDEYIEKCLSVFESIMEFEPGGKPLWRRRSGIPHAFALYGWLRERLEGYRFDNIAGAVQRWTERMLCEWVRRAVRETGIGRVALAGGVFMNVKANQAIGALPEVEELFVLPSGGDEMNAYGAAVAASARARPGEPPNDAPIGDMYWGEAITEKTVGEIAGKAAKEFSVSAPDDPAREVARLLADGEIVARVAGRSEFGARALGNRSLLADPSRPDVVRELNEAVKNRDFWMPFAATVLAERADDYLVNPKAIPAPFMILAFDTTDKRDEIRAATHPYENTIRPQVLEREINPGYHETLKAFEDLTGRGALLNTSYNLHGEPMVYSAADALKTLRESGLRWLLLGDRLIEKR